MRFIPTRVHALLDYVLGIVIAVFPYATGYAYRGVVGYGCAVLGLGLFVYSLFTNYEYAAVRIIPMKVHLGLDALGGLVLIILALAAGGPSGATVPLLILGVLEIGSSMMTQVATSDDVGELAPTIRTSTRRARVAMPIATGPHDADGRPDYPAFTGTPRTVEQERGAIDSGREHDKIAMTDPAMAPLGSDDEAAEPHDEEGLRIARERTRR